MSHTVPPEVEELIADARVMAHLATSVDDRPHVAPVWYDYADGTVEILTSGRKLANVRRNPRVALSIQKDTGGRTEWMVAIQGTATVVEDEGETRAAARRINAKYGAGETAYAENALVRIAVGSATCRLY
ncbi:pyridoxamine 5'-phosphate oxidase family protein [Halegenticoccus soli]|uniref:pyridoxamine 5'-phosphate oxidase family protein n=1 Tax=Halegenticoccus soli TaxID=1985678 RepID=UPI000C6DCE86|nr:pyridoxamine 5'-phosphate oxidase family protein [Halegenticoccus soli]